MNVQNFKASFEVFISGRIQGGKLNVCSCCDSQRVDGKKKRRVTINIIVIIGTIKINMNEKINSQFLSASCDALKYLYRSVLYIFHRVKVRASSPG